MKDRGNINVDWSWLTQSNQTCSALSGAWRNQNGNGWFWISLRVKWNYVIDDIIYVDLDLGSTGIQVGALNHTRRHSDLSWTVTYASSQSLLTALLQFVRRRPLKPRNLPLPVEVCAGEPLPLISHVQAIGVFFHWVCHPYCIVQFWLWPLHLLLCPYRKYPRCFFAVCDERRSVFSLALLLEARPPDSCTVQKGW